MSGGGASLAYSAGYNSGMEGSQRSAGGSSGKNANAPDTILGDTRDSDAAGGGGQRISTSAGGIEDLKTWLKHESDKKYQESLKKLGLDASKIQGKHLVSYSLDDL